MRKSQPEPRWNFKKSSKWHKRKIMKYCLCQTSISLVSIMKHWVSKLKEERANIGMCTKPTSEAVMKRLEKNLEIELDNEPLQCRQANATIK